MSVHLFSEKMEGDLFKALAHGDEDHRAWLREAIACFSACRPVPPSTGKGTKEAAHIAGLKEAIYIADNKTISEAQLRPFEGLIAELRARISALESTSNPLTNQAIPPTEDNKPK